METISQSRLWKRLLETNLVSGQEPDFEPQAPWYIKILMAISGWIAAMSILGFLALALLDVFDDASYSTMAGLVLLIWAFFILRSKHSDFKEHLGLALSCAGQGLLIWALFSEANSKEFWLGFSLMQLLLSLLMFNALHRSISALSLLMGLEVLGIQLGWPWLAQSLGLIAVCYIWLNEFKFGRHTGVLQALAYGLTLGVLLLSGLDIRYWLYDIFTNVINQPNLLYWIVSMIESGVALSIVAVLLKRNGYQLKARPSLFIMGLSLSVCLLASQASGVPIALIILVLGFCNQNKILMTLGIVFGLGYLSSYYYHLGSTLLEKALILLVLAFVLAMVPHLVARYVGKGDSHE